MLLPPIYCTLEYRSKTLLSASAIKSGFPLAGSCKFQRILELWIFQVFTVGLKQLPMLCSMFRNFAAYAPHLEITLVEWRRCPVLSVNRIPSEVDSIAARSTERVLELSHSFCKRPLVCSNSPFTPAGVQHAG